MHAIDEHWPVQALTSPWMPRERLVVLKLKQQQYSRTIEGALAQSHDIQDEPLSWHDMRFAVAPVPP
jgi:hypothetical protein